MINGTHDDPDEASAKQLFPHTLTCAQRMREGVVREGRTVPCTCPARAGRKSFLHIIRRVRTLAYVDSYANIRHQAKLRAERARSPEERAAYIDVAVWAENFEIGELEAGP